MRAFANNALKLSDIEIDMFPFFFQMKKDMKSKEKKKKHVHHHDTDHQDADDMIHCEEDLTVLKLEFFLVMT